MRSEISFGLSDYDYYYGNNGKQQGFEEGENYYGNYRNDSGNGDSFHGETENHGRGNGAVGYYETYDEYGHPRPSPNEPGIEIYQNNPYNNQGGEGSPPPLPPPLPGSQGAGTGGGGQANRQNLLQEIRNGMKLRKTPSPKE